MSKSSNKPKKKIKIGLGLRSNKNTGLLEKNFYREEVKENTKEQELEKTKKNEPMLLLLSAPSINNKYYKKHHQEIVNFQLSYIHKVVENGTDEIRILVNQNTRKCYQGKIDDSLIIDFEMYDIWMRDFTTVNPENPVQFVYSSASMSKKESKKTQRIFDQFDQEYQIKRKKSNYILDGGNIVYNYSGKLVTTTRFLKDNNLQFEEAKEILKALFQADHVAIIEPDDGALAHADGMVAWIENDVLLVNNYSKLDREFHKRVLQELQDSFTDITIITVPVIFDETIVDNKKKICSAYGINLNLVSTYTTLYVPIYGEEYEEEVLQIIRNSTHKNVITINSKLISLLGGSVRCLTWQLSLSNSTNILNSIKTKTKK
ncbi:agmatine deiminase-related [Anaeramoeba flamelloides]|uniref:Agmatine deiminase-related n=1 Tax=Anaeramoeba flamelloides TaxID=1746091 RepID=A0AAV7YU61_9EUKA|nr:agmatine deiminase-related [Anaeramoeba flamelloides]